MADNIGVKPDVSDTAVNVATDVVDNVHYPIYKAGYGADGDITLVSPTNSMPIDLTGLSGEMLTAMNELNGTNNKILKELKKMNFYNAMTHNQEVTNGDIS